MMLQKNKNRNPLFLFFIIIISNIRILTHVLGITIKQSVHIYNFRLIVFMSK